VIDLFDDDDDNVFSRMLNVKGRHVCFVLLSHVTLVSRRMQLRVCKKSRACRDFLSGIFPSSVAVPYVLPGDHHAEWHAVRIGWTVYAV